MFFDFEAWVVNNKVFYSFFQKPMARKTVINKKSALSEKTKVTTLSQDLIRRMKNTSEDLPISERIAIIDEYTTQLFASGYSQDQTRKIIEAGLLGYETLVKKVKKGEAVLHRSANEGAGARKRKKLLGKGNWFTNKTRFSFMEKLRKPSRKKQSNKEKEKDFTTVLFVKQTPNGILAKRLQKAENDISRLTGDRVKVVERGGTNIRRMLVKSNPWAGSLCGRDNCLPCMSADGKQDCFSKGVVYDMTCTTCEDEAKDKNDLNVPLYRYTGTTARSIYERGAEHLKAFRDGDPEKSVMIKHSLDKHEGKQIEFSIKIIKKHFSAFSRIVHEAIRIDRNSRNPLIASLNSKSEFGRGNLPRLVVDIPENLKVEKNDVVLKKNSPLEGIDLLNEIKKKEKDDRTEKVESSEDDPSKSIPNSNSNVTFVNLFNNDTPLTAAKNKPNNVGGVTKDFKCRQTTQRSSFRKVRKRKPS